MYSRLEMQYLLYTKIKFCELKIPAYTVVGHFFFVYLLNVLIAR